MRTISSTFLLLVSISCICAQEQDLKEIYTDVTTAINSALLTKKGSAELSGFFSYNYLKTEYEYSERLTEQIIQVEPGFSYFYFDNISFGFMLSYYYQKTENESYDFSMSNDQISIGPLIKYYFGEDRFRPFILTDYLFLTGDDFDGGELDIGGGILYHVTGNFGLSLQIKYGIIWRGNDNFDSQNRIFIGVGFVNFIL